MISNRRDSALHDDRRRSELEALAEGQLVDVLVAGGGITGAGIALDAASRGLRVVLAEKHDLAFGTSRWSSKLIHGGLRYLASGKVAIARESAAERGILMTRTAPHLVTPLQQIVPLHSSVSRVEEAVVRAGLAFGDQLRGAAGTSAAVLPRAGRMSPDQVAASAPTVRRSTLRGGASSWDGRVVDDARLVIAVARTAALYGASILTGVSVRDADRTSATLEDRSTGSDFRLRARVVINAAGVWAGDIDPRISLRPSRGTHLVFDEALFGGLTCSLAVPVPGERGRFVFALPAPLGRVYVGLTDERAEGPIPDVPMATESEIDFLLDVLGTAVEPRPTRADIVGTFAGLRPLIDSGPGPSASLSRRHAVLDDGNGPIGVVGGKLTTYRLMAEQAVDAAVAAARLPARAGRTTSIPLVGAAAPATLDSLEAPELLVRRYGTEAKLVLALAEHMPDGLEPVADGIDVCAAEFAFSVRYEGARSADDLLDRRTRIGLVDHDRDRAHPVAVRILAEHRGRSAG